MGGGAGLQDKCVGAATEPLDHRLTVLPVSQQYQPRVKLFLAAFANQFDGLEAVEIEINDGEIGPQFLNQAESFLAILALRDHLVETATFAERCEAFAQEGRLVG